MPYAKWDAVNNAIKGIKPKVTLAQANMIARWADKIEAEADVESPWAVAISQFKKTYVVRDGKWVKRTASEMAEITEALTKKVGTRTHARADFLVVEDPDKTTTWHLPVKVKGKANHRLMGGAWAALFDPEGFRGRPYAGPKKTEAKRKLKSLYKAEAMEFPEAEKEQRPLLKEMYDQDSGEWKEPPVFVPFGAITFEDVKQAEVADEYKAGVQKLVYSFGRLFENIMYARDPETMADLPMEDKLDKVRGLVDELATEIESLSPVAESTEAEPLSPDALALFTAAVTGEPLDLGETSEEEPVVEAETEVFTEFFAESEPVAGSFSESAMGHAIELVEVEEGRTEYDGGPLKLHMALIEPGWGNSRDNNYYPRKMLERDAKVFEGRKMYATDHRRDEKNVLTEVADITKVPVGFTETGAPIALVGIHNPAFAQDVWNRHLLGLEGGPGLKNLHCSILGNGEKREGFEQGGRKGNWIEAIKEGSADFVTQAGAGGRALALAESNGGERVTDEKKLEQEPTEADVKELGPAVPATIREKEDAFSAEDAAAIIDEATLPDSAKAQLKERAYSDADEVNAGVEGMRDLVEALTGSGQVSGLGPGAARSQRVTEEELAEKQNETLRRYGIEIPEVSNA